MQWIEAKACFTALWEIAAELEERITKHDGAGRPLECSAADVLLLESVTWNGLSYRKVENEFKDTKTWARIIETVAEAWPDHPERRLSERGPSRSQHARFRKKHLEFDEAVERLRAQCNEISASASETVGMFDPSDGSLTHPSSATLISGDATWIRSLYNAPRVDRETGEITDRRCDPDAIAHHGGQSAGRNLVLAVGRTAHDHERTILDLDFLAPSGKSDATLFTDMTLSLFERLPGARGTVYDMAMHGEDVDRILDAGRIPLTKVQRTGKGGIAHVNIGEHTFKLADKTTRNLPIVALDGTPAITIIVDGEQHLMPLVRRQTKSRANADGTTMIYGIWRVPQHDAVPEKLRGAEAIVRHNSTAYERENKTRRTRALRPIPESDADFDIFGRRELNESLHNHAKERLPLRRARCIGLLRQRINFHAYQLHLASTALIAWHYRTGGDLTPWFGRWRPPGARKLQAAA